MSHHAISSATKTCLAKEWPMWISGASVKTGETRDLVNPADDAVFAKVAVGDSTQVDTAVAAARAAQPEWASMNASQRAKILWKLADLIEENVEELAELECLSMGKPFGAAFHGEVPFFAETFRYFAGWCTKISGNSSGLSFPVGDLHGITLQEPVGVVGMILPWNGPLVIAGWKLAPALATGCTCVIKPADTTPLSILRVAELAKEAGVPDGVINIVTGPGSVVGAAMAAHPDINKLAFTGSTGVGRGLLHQSADSNLKKLTLELGGKSPVLVWPDANIKAAVDGAADAIFGNSGQVCVAGSRLYLHADMRDELLPKLVEKANALKVGDPFASDTEMGPIASRGHLEAIQAKVDAAIERGAKLLCGGAPIQGEGCYYPPTILMLDDQSDPLVQDEVFGPVLVVSTFKTEDEAVALANGTDFGLAASVWTRDINRAMRITRRLQCGIVWVNTHNIPDLAMPIGGYGQSGWGRELGQMGLSEYLQSKSVMIQIDGQEQSIL